jgi:hypothetical protein
MCDNRCEFEQQVSEEAHYHWTLKEFQELIKTHGARKVFDDLETDFIIKVTKELSSENS